MSWIGISVVRQYERGVVFRWGRLRGTREPGLRLTIPIVDRLRKVSLRTVTMPIASQQVITRDNASVNVAGVAYFRRVDAVKCIVEIEDVESAIAQIAQTTVRNVVGRSPLDDVLSRTESLNESIKRILDTTTEPVGGARRARRAQGPRAAPIDAAGDGPRGRGRAGEARQGDRRRG